MSKTKLLKVAAGIIGGATLLASVNAGASVQIIGYLGNFDVYNRTGSSMEGFEIDLPGLSTSDLQSYYPTYCGSAFGCGAGHNTSTGLGVVYGNSGQNPNAIVANGGITHFGVHLTKVPSAAISYNWLDRNTSDGKLYYQGTTNIAAGYPTPPPPPPVVSNTTVVTPNWVINGSNQLVATITNTTDHPFWVQGVSAEDNTTLTLDQLFSTDPLFSTLTMAEAQLLEPGDTLSEPGDILASTIGGRAMFWIYGFSGLERETDVRDDGRVVYGHDCPDTGCDFTTMHGALQSRMMTAANIGEVTPVPVPVAAWLMGSGLAGLFSFGARRRIQA